MKKDIKWLKKELKKCLATSLKYDNHYAYGNRDAYNIALSYVDELEKLEKPDIPQFVADYIEKWEHKGLTMNEWFVFVDSDVDDDVSKWLYDNNYEENTRREYLLIDAIRYGYEVEKEPVYFAKIKGHELVETKTILDDDTGDDVSEFYRNIYFVLQRDGELIVDMKDNGLSGAKNVMTMSQWSDLGINETNADFEEVTE